jgi:PelA/Pel-15E family pectate lyase
MFRSAVLALAIVLVLPIAGLGQQKPSTPPNRAQILTAMKRATTFMVERVSNNGGFVWGYSPDLSKRWGEMEARASMIWMQPPGTATVGHLLLDAYHATGDEYYYQAAERTARAVIWAQLPVGGWNYIADYAGEQSLKDWYATIGKHGWRLEEFQHYWGNATFDDVTTIDAARLLLRMYLEKRDPVYRPSLDKAIKFVLDSQYPMGGWPQRYPAKPDFIPDYTSFITFNDDVAGENIDFLLQCYQTLGDNRLIDPILRGMQAFIVLQGGQPQPGWALQYTTDYKPTGARTYEPDAYVTHTSATNIALLMRFHRITGDSKYLARIPEALDWLEKLTLPAGVATAGRTHPTFVEIGTNKPLYVHREGSNIANGRYFANYDSTKTIGHYSAFRKVDVAGLRAQYNKQKAMTPAEASKGSPLVDPNAPPLPRYFALDPAANEGAADVIAGLNADGAWITALEYISNPYKGPAPAGAAKGDYATTHVGDEWDTSPFPNTTVQGISTAMFIKRMTTLIKALDATPAAPVTREPIAWRLDNLKRIGGHAVTLVGAPKVVNTPTGSALEFDGQRDAVVVESNPLEGLAAFRLEVEVSPALDGPDEQRFVHVGENGTDNRAMLETRMAGSRWSLDTFLRSNASQLTLVDGSRIHDAGTWHTAALVYDGKTMSHFVDGVREAEGQVFFAALGPGRTSLGARLNQMSWFKGRLRALRVTPVNRSS